MCRRILLALVLACSLVACAAPAAHAHVTPTRNLEALAHVDEFPVPSNGIRWAYSSCWAYVHSDGREYALLGVSNGTAIYNITDPEAPFRVAFIPGPPSIWREMKQYRSWVYIVTEGTGTGRGVQIVRMTNPDLPVLVNTYSGAFQRSHTVSVDTTRALLMCSGTWNGTGFQTGVRVLSLANPESPVEIGAWPGTPLPLPDSSYVHDVDIDGTRWWLSSIGAGLLRLVDATNPAQPVLLRDFGYPLARTHSSSLGENGRHVYATNEDNALPITIIDVLDPKAMQVVGEFTSNPVAIMHNPRVLGSELWVSAYTEGVRVFDLTDPLRPALCAWGDTYDGPSGGYNGIWEVCPYLPSGTIVASDMSTGLHLFRARREHGFLWVRVRDAGDQSPLAGAHAALASGDVHSETAADGYCTLAPMAGADVLHVSRFGYESVSLPFSITQGGRDTIDVALTRLPTRDVTVAVTHATTLAPIEGAHVEFQGTPIHGHTGADGRVSLGETPIQSHDVEVTAPGFVSREFAWWPAAAPLSVPLSPVAHWDALETWNAGWIVGATGDDATSGLWTRVEPLGTGPRPAATRPQPALERPGFIPRPRPSPLHEEETILTQGNAAPYFDNTPSPGSFCFVTGQGTDSTQWDQADVDGGRTTLTSPWLPVSGMSRPTLSLWRWFYSHDALDTEQPDPDDSLTILVTANGLTWVRAETIRGWADRWTESRFDVQALVGPSNFVRVRFVATDGNRPTAVEAAIDDVALWDGEAEPLSVPPTGGSLRMGRAEPNPASEEVTFAVMLVEAHEVRLEVHDISGRLVHAESRRLPAGESAWRWDGRSNGSRAPAGVYHARLRVGEETRVRRFALTR